MSMTLKDLIERHGWRMRRATAMTVLSCPSKAVFEKVVEQNPQICKRLRGEGQTKYLTEEIFKLLAPTTPARCVTNGEDKSRNNNG